jgi:hypothetical protein
MLIQKPAHRAGGEVQVVERKQEAQSVNTSTTKNLETDTHSSTIYTNKKRKQLKLSSTNEWTMTFY